MSDTQDTPRMGAKTSTLSKARAGIYVLLQTFWYIFFIKLNSPTIAILKNLFGSTVGQCIPAYVLIREQDSYGSEAILGNQLQELFLRRDAAYLGR